MHYDSHMTSKPPPIFLTTLRQPWLNLARGVWIFLSGTAILLAAIGSIRIIQEPLPKCTLPDSACAPFTFSEEDLSLAQDIGLPAQFVLLAYILASLIPKIAFSLVGMILFFRRSDDWVAQILTLTLLLFILEGITDLGALMPIVNVLYGLSSLLFGLLPFIFPNGRFVPRWVVWIVVPVIILLVLGVFLPQIDLSVSEDLIASFIILPSILWFIVAAYSVVYRYTHVSTPTEQQQTKWVITGLLGSTLVIIPITIISVYFPPSQPSTARLTFFFLVFFPVYLLSYLMIPGGIAFAILRYRLYDIDIIIRRTLQYTVLTGLLVLTYFGSIILLQSIFSTISNQQSEISIVISTLAIAALFTPLRNRVQDFIDRRFYRKKYNAERALAQFAAIARDEVDMDKLTAALLGVVQETVQPEHVSIRLIGDR